VADPAVALGAIVAADAIAGSLRIKGKIFFPFSLFSILRMKFCPKRQKSFLKSPGRKFEALNPEIPSHPPLQNVRNWGVYV